MTAAFKIETRNLDGQGAKRVRVFALPAVAQGRYWEGVTDVPCPCCDGGTARWAEAGFVPGYRICDECGRHFLAGGTAADPTLTRVGARRGMP